MDQFSTVTNQSYFSRIKKAFFGVLIGLILFIGSFFLLSWNEGRSIKRVSTINEGIKIYVKADSKTINPQNNNKLIHIGGKANTNNILSDDTFNLSINALKLKRTVQMYQWKETKEASTDEKIGGSSRTKTIYTYNKVWHEGQIDSTGFHKSTKYKNPELNIDSKIYEANKVYLGNFLLHNIFAKQIDFYEPIPLPKNILNAQIDLDIKTLPINDLNHYKAKQVDVQSNNNSQNDVTENITTTQYNADSPAKIADVNNNPPQIEARPATDENIKVNTPKITHDPQLSVEEKPTSDNTGLLSNSKNTSVPSNISVEEIKTISPYIIHGNSLFKGDNISAPKVGDIKITFSAAKPQNISIIGKQEGSSISPYKTKVGSLELLERGLVDPDIMFKNAKNANSTMTWLIRGGGILMIYIGLALIINPIRVILSFLPFLGSIFEFLSGIVLFVVSLALGLITISIAWVAYRPIMALLVIGGSILLISTVIPIIKKKKNSNENHHTNNESDLDNLEF